MLPIDRTAKSTLDNNLVNGNTSDAPAVKANNDVAYNTIDELNAKVDSLVGSSALSPYPPSFLSRQALINGNFEVWQRGSSFSGSNFYTADRWITSFGGGGATVSKVGITIGDAFSPYHNLLRFNQTTPGTSNPNLIQRIESVYNFAGQNIAARFKARAVTGGPFSVDVFVGQFFGTGGTPSATVFTKIGTANITTTAQEFTMSAAIPNVVGKTLGTNGDDFVIFQFNLPINVNFQIDFAYVSFNVGTVGLPFQPKSLDNETKDSMRFAWIPQANSVFVRATSYGANTITFDVPLPVQLRTTPSIRGVANTDIVVNTVAAAAQSGFTFSAALTSNGVRITATKTGHGLTDAYLEIKTTSGFDSEL